METGNKDKNLKVIDIVGILKKMYKNRKIYYVTLPIAFVVSCLIIICIPRYYKCEVTLAPEMSSSSNLGSISSLASSFGINVLNKMTNEDAISPELYPDLMESTNFIVSLFPIQVTSKDGKIKTTYYEYLKKHQEAPWWTHVMNSIKNIFKGDENTNFNGKGRVSPFRLTKEQKDILDIIGGKIKCSTDKKTDVISIMVEDQDPLICATIADSVRVKLQSFITDYRTNKARVDLKYTKELYEESKKEYEKARQIYASFADSNNDILLESVKIKQTDLENDMQLKYNIYSTLTAQVQAAYAKVQERTPAFTTLKCASVPQKPAGPKRMFFVIFLTLLTFVGSSVYIVVKENKL